MSHVHAGDCVWITRRDDDAVESAANAATGALAGMTVGVKDNIDVAGMPTTAGCPEFAYVPTDNAPCVSRLERAGAVIVGKTNMDQFATGLVGTRSPYGALSSVANPEVVSGGSSSGSAVAVASGHCDVALGTDTAGSGRVPAALNGIVGLKPSRSLISTRGVVPACKSIDCVSIFASSVADARRALLTMVEPDARPLQTDGISRSAAVRAGVPAPGQLTWFDPEAQPLFGLALERLQSRGVQIVEIDFAPFLAAGELLYNGPWVAERFAAVGTFLTENPTATLDPDVSGIILDAQGVSAVDAYNGMYHLQELLAAAQPTWHAVDLLALPTVALAPTHADVAADRVGVNTRLGHYTRFVNLMDLCAISIPAGRWSTGVPFGLQLVGPATQDLLLCEVAERFLRPSRSHPIRLAVVGAHLRGQPLNHQLTDRGGRFVASTTTAAEYRLFRLPGDGLPKPGLLHTPDDATTVGAIEVEVWELDPAAFGSFVAEVPPPLAIGTLRLADGTMVKGFVCEPWPLGEALEITGYGGWRRYLAGAVDAVADARA